jgi:integrase
VLGSIAAEAEVERLIDAISSHRDAAAILLAYRHGLRASELVELQWDQIDFVQKTRSPGQEWRSIDTLPRQ